MSDDNEADEFKKKLNALKPKKKIDAAEGLLNDAKSYEGKQMAIRIIAERELKRTVLLFKGMIAQGRQDVIRLQAEQEQAKREERALEIAQKKLKEQAEKNAKKSLFGKFKGKK